MFFRFGKVKLHYFPFVSCLKKHHSRSIWPENVILGFMEEIQDQHSIIINHILPIYKHYLSLPRNSESLNFIGLKLYVRNKNFKRKNSSKEQLFKKVSRYQHYVTQINLKSK